MNNTIRAYSSMPVMLELDDVQLRASKLPTAADSIENNESNKAPLRRTQDSTWLPLIVKRRTVHATDIIGLEIASKDGRELPTFDAGAHIDVQIREGLVRQYSLTGNPANTSTYRLGILRDRVGEGRQLRMKTM